jgi:hypothetical protein
MQLQEVKLGRKGISLEDNCKKLASSTRGHRFKIINDKEDRISKQHTHPRISEVRVTRINLLTTGKNPSLLKNQQSILIIDKRLISSSSETVLILMTQYHSLSTISRISDHLTNSPFQTILSSQTRVDTVCLIMSEGSPMPSPLERPSTTCQ